MPRTKATTPKIPIPFYSYQAPKYTHAEKSFIHFLLAGEPEKQIFRFIQSDLEHLQYCIQHISRIDNHKVLLTILQWLYEEQGVISLTDEEHRKAAAKLLESIIHAAYNQGDDTKPGKFLISDHKTMILDSLELNRKPVNIGYKKFQDELPWLLRQAQHTLYQFGSINYQQYVNVKKAQLARLAAGQKITDPEPTNFDDSGFLDDED